MLPELYPLLDMQDSQSIAGMGLGIYTAPRQLALTREGVDCVFSSQILQTSGFEQFYLG